MEHSILLRSSSSPFVFVRSLKTLKSEILPWKVLPNTKNNKNLKSSFQLRENVLGIHRQKIDRKPRSSEDKKLSLVFSTKKIGKLLEFVCFSSVNSTKFASFLGKFC